MTINQVLKKLTKLSILNLEKVVTDFYSNKIIPVDQDHGKSHVL